MKRFILSILLVLTLASQSFAYTCTAVLAGNWTTLATWAGTCNNTYPQAGDTVDLNGIVVVMDVTRIPDSGDLAAIGSAGKAGQITVALDTLGSSSINVSGGTITAGTKPATSGIILVTGATANVLTITANIVGGSNTSSYGINHNSTGTVNIVGNVTGGSSASGWGVFNTTSGSITISGLLNGATGGGCVNASTGSVTTGNVLGGSATTIYGLRLFGNGVATVNGTVTGGSGSGAWGIDVVGNGNINITGDITGGSSATAYGVSVESGTGTIAIVGNITGGSNTAAHGVYYYGTGSVSINGVITGGSSLTAVGFYNVNNTHVTLSQTSKLVQSTVAPAYQGYAPAWTSPTTGGASYYIGASFGQAANTLFPQQVTAPNLKAGVVSGAVTGTLAGGGSYGF